MGEKKEFKKQYDKKLQELQIERVKLQDGVMDRGKKVAIILEGRDADGKGRHTRWVVGENTSQPTWSMSYIRRHFKRVTRSTYAAELNGVADSLEPAS